MKNLKDYVIQEGLLRKNLGLGNDARIQKLVEGLCNKFDIKNKKNVEIAIKKLVKKFGFGEISPNNFFEWDQPDWFQHDYSKKEIAKMCIDKKSIILGVYCNDWEYVWNADTKEWEEQ